MNDDLGRVRRFDRLARFKPRDGHLDDVVAPVGDGVERLAGPADPDQGGKVAAEPLGHQQRARLEFAAVDGKLRRLPRNRDEDAVAARITRERRVAGEVSEPDLP